MPPQIVLLTAAALLAAAVKGQNPAPFLVEERSRSYCSPPGVGLETSRDHHYSPGEGNAPNAWVAGWKRASHLFGGGSASMELQHVTLVVRHGDRAGMTDIPRTDRSGWDCSVPASDMASQAIFRSYRARYEAYPCLFDPYLDTTHSANTSASVAVDAASGEASGTEEGVSSTSPECGPGAVGKVTAPNPGSKGLDPSMHSPGSRCEHGQLTHTGMLQHQRLGVAFRGILAGKTSSFRVDASGAVTRGGKSLLGACGADGWASLVRVSSTNYGRTVLSAASFWEGLSPQRRQAGFLFDEKQVLRAVGAQDEVPCELNTSSSVGEGRRVVRVVPREMDPLLAAKDHSRCPLSQRIKDEAHSSSRRHRRLGRDTGRAVAALTRMGGGKAAEQAKAATMRTLSAADLINTRICTGQPLPCALDAGGRPASESQRRSGGNGTCLSSSTALRILRDADRDYGSRFGGPDVKLLMFPALHGIALQLRAVFEGASELRLSARFAHDIAVYPLLAVLGAGDSEWPGYASRIAFELWTFSTASGGGPVGLVRVLYQGEDITPSLDCSRSWGGAEGGRAEEAAWAALAGTACTVQSFERQVMALLYPHRTYGGACALGPFGPVRAAAQAPTADQDGGGSRMAGPF